MTEQVVRTLSLLTPWDPVGPRRVRVGGGEDGGYVVLDCMRPDQTILSYGVGPDISFDHELAQRGMQSHLFDHTVTALPVEHPNLHWHKEGVGPVPDPAVPVDTIANHVATYGNGRGDLILKIDVEGAEWHAFLETPDEVLLRFEQILVEWHSFQSLVHEKDEPGLRFNVLSKINRHFRPFHVHSNNSQDLFTVCGLPVANLLEVSYARMDLCGFRPSRTLYPTALDEPCMPSKPEHKLWFFPFIPLPGEG